MLKSKPGDEDTCELEKISSHLAKIIRSLTLGDRLSNSDPVVKSSIPPVRLLKLNLPKFSGNLLEWPEFYEGFQAAIDCTSLSEIEKFTYLRGQLSDVPLTLISELSLTSSNYKVGINLLKRTVWKRKLNYSCTCKATFAVRERFKF